MLSGCYLEILQAGVYSRPNDNRIYLYLVREGNVLEVGEACENVAPGGEIQTPRHVHVTLLPNRNQKVLWLFVYVHFC